MTDNRILVHLSMTSLHTVYSLEKQLDNDRNIIMYTSESDSIKSATYVKYKSNIEQLHFMLIEEIKYQKGESDEQQMVKAYRDLIMGESSLSEEELECQLEE